MKRNLVSLFLPLLIISAFFMPETSAQSSAEVYKMKKIVLDPGHGGRDAGCTSGNYKEKDIVLKIALRVGELINRNLPDLEVIYTRKTDVFVDLMDRAHIANRAHADLFISIHADAVASSSPRGSSAWVMGSSQEETNLRVAMRENSVITYEDNYQTKYQGFSPNDPASYIMFSLMQSAYFDQSVKLGGLIQKYYGQRTSIPINRGVKQAGILVLHHTAMPSILTEIGFLTNAGDRAFMTSATGQEKIAQAIFNAISEYKSTVEGNTQIVLLDGETMSSSPATASASSLTGSPETASNSSVSGSGNSRQAADASASTTFVTQRQGAPLVFRVQVSASPTRVAHSRFGSYSRQVTEKKIGDYYKYFVGETKTYSEALSLQLQVRSKFKDAFVVAFENDQPVAITDAMKRN